MTKVILPEEIREKIAGRIVRTVAPVIILAMMILIVALLAIGDGRLQRVISPIIVMMFMVPSWILAHRNRPIYGANVQLLFFTLSILYAMINNGGIHAPVHVAALPTATFLSSFTASGRAFCSG